MGALAPLRIPAFQRLLATYSINELGDVFGVVALSILVFDETHDALATTALFVAARFVPALLAPLLTARLDRTALRTSLARLYVVEALCFAVLAWLSEHFSLALVLTFGFADGVLAVTGRGLTRGAIASTLPTDALLRAGNALVNIGFAVASVAGPVLAAGLVSGVGVGACLVVDAVSFALIAVLIATSTGLPERQDTEATGLLARVREGLAHVRGDRSLRLLLLGQSFALVLFTLVVPIEVVYVKDTLSEGDFGLGLLMASWGAGMLAGSGLVVAARAIRPATLVLLATGLVGAGYAGMGLSRTLALAMLASFVGGVGNGIQWVSVMTLLQSRTPLELQARVAGLLESIGQAVPGVGFLLGGLLTSFTDAATTYLAAGIAVLVLVAAAAALRLRPRRRPGAPSGGA